jgi:ribosome biogenesis GTPase
LLNVIGQFNFINDNAKNTGVVTALLARDNILERSHKLIAANIDELWLVVAIEPHYQFDSIDRYLVVAENSNLPIRIIVNKIDLSHKLELPICSLTLK